MLNTKKFVDELVKTGYEYITCVPCSFAKSLINEVINRDDIEYIPCHNEGGAVSVAAGLILSGKKALVIMQSSGMTNAGSPITSLLNPYDIHVPIMTSLRTYEEGDSEIQHKVLSTNLPVLIESYGYYRDHINETSEESAVKQLEQNKTIVIFSKNTFSPVKLQEKSAPNNYIKRSEFLKVLNKLPPEKYIFVGTTGNTCREMYQFMDKTKNFYMVGNMGHANSLGLGMAMANPDKIIVVLGGDAEFAMHMGSVVTSGRYQLQNLKYVVFDNEMNKSTGGQNTYQEHVDYNRIATSVGLEPATIIETPEVLMRCLDLDFTVVTFIHVLCGLDEECGRPTADDIIKSKEVFK